jgi:hypothetical protein
MTVLYSFTSGLWQASSVPDVLIGAVLVGAVLVVADNAEPQHIPWGGPVMKLWVCSRNIHR